MPNVVYISLPGYLADWLGGAFADPRGVVHFPKGSIEAKVLEQSLTSAPEGWQRPALADSSVAVGIPPMKTKPAETCNYLPPRGERLLLSVLQDRFDVEMWKALHPFNLRPVQMTDVIYAWMEAEGIELTETNWNAIHKRYQRKRKTYLSNKRKKAFRLKNVKIAVK